MIPETQWLAEKIQSSITHKFDTVSPSELAERIRFIPASTSNNPGPFRWGVSPYMREILDCFSPDSPVWIVAVKKGVQVAFTVAVLENLLLYYIYQVRTSPVLFVTADNELADMRVQTQIVPMIQASNMEHLIQSSDRLSSKKQGKTGEKIEFQGGGFIMPIGAKNPAKMRSLPFPCVLCDEVDGWPLTTTDGKPFDLVTARSKTFEDNRKILVGSTPVLSGTSIVEDEYRKGDQRKYYVKCLGCAEEQDIRWERKDEHGNKIGGIFWDLKDGEVIRDSVKYVCHHCGFAHSESDKQRLLYQEFGAYWKPTAQPIDPGRRSYHVPALISTVQSWYACVVDFLGAVGPEGDASQPKDIEKLRVFYNNILGEPFEMIGFRVTDQQVLAHKRIDYAMGTVPVKYSREVTGAPISILVCTVDVQPTKGNLAVSVWGWTPGFRAFLIDYRRLDGNPLDTQDKATWGELDRMLCESRYMTDEGGSMPITLAAVDSGSCTAQVYEFCGNYPTDPIYPIKGRDEPIKGSTMPFAPFKTTKANAGFHIVVDHYKELWSQALRKNWNPGTLQPEYFFNAPVDVADDALKELTKEYKRPRKVVPGKPIPKKAYEWHRPNGSNNELWDLLIYSSALLDIACHDICTNVLEIEGQDWDQFWVYIKNL